MAHDRGTPVKHMLGTVIEGVRNYKEKDYSVKNGESADAFGCNAWINRAYMSWDFIYTVSVVGMCGFWLIVY